MSTKPEPAATFARTAPTARSSDRRFGIVIVIRSEAAAQIRHSGKIARKANKSIYRNPLRERDLERPIRLKGGMFLNISAKVALRRGLRTGHLIGEERKLAVENVA
eukprot:gene7916-10080_t